MNNTPDNTATPHISTDKALITLLKYNIENSIKLTSIMKRQLELKALLQHGTLDNEQVNEELSIRLAQIDELVQKEFRKDLEFITS
jgi:citrate synthase